MRKTIICLSLNLLTISSFAQTAVLKETFDDNRNGWLDKPYRDTSINASIAGGVLQIANNNKDSNWSYTIRQKIDEQKDFEIQLRFMIKEGTNKTRSYGSLYWGGDDSQANTWVLFSQRRIKVKNCLGGDHKSDQIFQKNNSPSLKKGVFYQLVIRKQDKIYKVLLDGSLLFELPFQSFKGDNISFAAGKFTTVAFDDLKIFYSNSK
ncbi:hypothetical protein [Sphingobacterium siyangense]|uniref:hypothetical protein n=1 Tax=Sphingobacterium siyangense TaxID=459529 RepID=UPI002FDDCB86